MKNLSILHVLLTLIIFCPSQIIKASLREHIFSELRRLDYNQTTTAIDNSYNLNRPIKQHIMSKYPALYIEKNQLKLKKIETSLRKQEKKEINTLLEENGLNKTQRKQTLDILEQAHKEHKNFLSQISTKPAMHDTKAYIHIKNIEKHLGDEKYSLRNIHILQKETSLPEVFTEFFSDIKHTYTITNKGTIKNYQANIGYDTLILNPTSDSDAYKTQLAIQAIESVLEGHIITEQILAHLTHDIFWISKHTKEISSDDSNSQDCVFDFGYHNVTKSFRYNDLVIMQQQIANALAAIRNPKSSAIIRSLHRRENIYNDRHGKHYQLLSTIDETHKMIDYLKKTSNRHNLIHNRRRINTLKNQHTCNANKNNNIDQIAFFDPCFTS